MKRMIKGMLAGVMALAVCDAWAQTRTQTVTLEKGWNAVWLEVQPTVRSLSEVFEGLPVDIVAGYSQPVSEAQFVKNTAVNIQTLAGWNVWYAPHRADASLSRLHRFSANSGYLVHALDAVALTIQGMVTGDRVRWTPNRFNLVGFSVAAQGGPTFKEFFQGSKAHNHNKIYRLANGVWRQVLAPANETFRSGEAFWIYCDGASEYQGPLTVKANTPVGLILNGSLQGTLEFSNASPHPLAYSMEQVADNGNAVLPLAAVVIAVSTNAAGPVNMPISLPDGAAAQDFPSLDAGKGLSLPIVLRIGEMQSGSYTGMFKVTTDLGTQTWVPIRATLE